MDVFALIIAVIALVLLVAAGFNAAAKVKLTALGLAFLTLAWIVELSVRSGATRFHF